MIGVAGHTGRVKVLDFGLAKLIDSEPPIAGASTMPDSPSTSEGRIVGTVAYLSPEQAAGKAIDSRSDLFSLGVILYEMATGQKPFTGDTSVAVLSSILKDTPASVADFLWRGGESRPRSDKGPCVAHHLVYSDYRPGDGAIAIDCDVGGAPPRRASGSPRQFA
jgi:serine/threonine protein kinase